jgi:hypothetical protein
MAKKFQQCRGAGEMRDAGGGKFMELLSKFESNGNVLTENQLN